MQLLAHIPVYSEHDAQRQEVAQRPSNLVLDDEPEKVVGRLLPTLEAHKRRSFVFEMSDVMPPLLFARIEPFVIPYRPIPLMRIRAPTSPAP